MIAITNSRDAPDLFYGQLAGSCSLSLHKFDTLPLVPVTNSFNKEWVLNLLELKSLDMDQGCRNITKSHLSRDK